MIWVKEVWEIGWWGIVKTLGRNTQDAAAIKEYKYSEAGFLITLCYLRNTSTISILGLVCYWAVNINLAGVYFIHSGINL